MTQIPDSAKRKIEGCLSYEVTWAAFLFEDFDEAQELVEKVLRDFGIDPLQPHLAKSETPDRHELKEWKTSHPYFVTGSLVSDAEVKAYNAGQAYKTPEPRAE